MVNRQIVLLAACILAFAFGPARAQDDDDDGDDAGAAPVVVNIDGPCRLTAEGRPVPCQGVTYMVFPSNHRIDFTAITETAGWAFSGEEDQNEDGRYTLELDSVLNADSDRLEAQGRCEMQVSEDRRTVTSLDCQAVTEDGAFTLQASGTISVEDGDSDEPDEGDD